MSSIKNEAINCIDVVITKQTNTFHIVDAAFNCDTARKTVENIAFIMENQLKYSSADPKHDVYLQHNFTHEKFMTVLKRTAHYITQKYNNEITKTIKTHGKIINFFL